MRRSPWVSFTVLMARNTLSWRRSNNSAIFSDDTMGRLRRSSMTLTISRDGRAEAVMIHLKPAARRGAQQARRQVGTLGFSDSLSYPRPLMFVSRHCKPGGFAYTEVNPAPWPGRVGVGPASVGMSLLVPFLMPPGLLFAILIAARHAHFWV